MKQATLCTFALLSVAAWPALAQTPDTTSAWRYFPLEVGNVWEYEHWLVLGRRVLAEDLGYTAAEVQHRLGAAQLPAGVYVVRLTGDAGAMVTARFVRQ